MILFLKRADVVVETAQLSGSDEPGSLQIGPAVIQLTMYDRVALQGGLSLHDGVERRPSETQLVPLDPFERRRWQLSSLTRDDQQERPSHTEAGPTTGADLQSSVLRSVLGDAQSPHAGVEGRA